MNTKYIQPVIFIIASLLTWCLFRDMFIHPNSWMMACGSDQNMIYFDTIWQTKWGGGIYIYAMSYPNKELLAMCGGQAFLAWFFNIINTHFFSISNYTVGICNALDIYLLPIGVVVSYRLLKRLHFTEIISILGAFLFIFLAPQLSRTNCGHINLGYPIYIPLVMLWSLNIVENKNKILYCILSFIVMTMFGFNNSYFIPIGSGFMVVVALFLFYKKLKNAIYLFIPSVLSIGLLFTLIKTFDIVKDRVDCPWGFNYYLSGIRALFVAQYGNIGHLWQPASFWHNVENECYIYIGFLALPIFLFTILYFLKSINKEKIIITNNDFSLGLFVSALCIYIFSCGILFKWNWNWFEKHLTFFAQFRSAGRVAWPVFYVGLIYVFYCAEWMYNKWICKWKLSYKYFAIIFFTGFYVFEMSEWLKYNNMFKAQNRCENLYTDKKIDALEWNTNIKPTDFQAIYVLPVTQMWTDKIGFQNYTNSIFGGLHYAYKYHLPLINAMMSRMSYGQTLNEIQMCSSPYIYKKLLDSLPNTKPILVVNYTGNELSDGEENLKNTSTHLFTTKDGYELYAYYPKNQMLDSIRYAYNFVKNKPKQSPYLFIDKNDSINYQSILGNGFFFQANENENKTIIDTTLNIFDTTNNVQLNYWTKTTLEKYGNAETEIILKDSKGNEYLKEYQHSDQKNIYKGWVMHNIILGKIKPKSRLIIKGFTSRNGFFDSFLIKYQKENIGINLNDSTVIFNNFYIEKKYCK